MDDRQVAVTKPQGWWLDVALLAALVAITGGLANGGFLLDLDLAIRDWCDAHRPPAAFTVVRVLNLVGQGSILTLLALVLALALLWRARTVRPLLPVATAFVLTTVTVLPFKLWTDRAAPSSSRPDAVELFNHLPPGEYSQSYPAGHVVVAVVWYGVVVLLVDCLLRATGRAPMTPALRRILRVAPPLVVLGTTTYLSFHWLTDDLAALCLGVLLWRLMARIRWDRVPLPGRLGGWAGPLP